MTGTDGDTGDTSSAATDVNDSDSATHEETVTDPNTDTHSETSSGSDSTPPPPAGVTKDAEGMITFSGLTVVSYGGYLNAESFQQDGILSYNGYQYTAFWNTNRNVVMARRLLPDGEWEKFDFKDYANHEDDAHNTISLGICPKDGTLHLSFDHHGSPLHYRKSIEGLVSDPASALWGADSFSGVTDNLTGQSISQVTYPRFVTAPGGDRMLLALRIGTSGSGDEHLWEYDADTHAWTSLGKFIDGITDDVNAYLHGISYGRSGDRLHVAWCWRATSDAKTNQDLFYMYSDDHGRTWKDNGGDTIAQSGASFVRIHTSSAKVWSIEQNRGLINQEHMIVDVNGNVHVLVSHMPDDQPSDGNFTSARTKSEFFHYWRDKEGTWSREPLSLSVIANFRGSLASSASGNLYAVLPGLRIAGASRSERFSDWQLLESDNTRNYFSDPLIDTARLLTEDKLTIYYPEASSPNIWGLEFTLK